MIDAKEVIRIGNDGKTETILHSNSAWTITSGLFDNAGNMWVLENSLTNEVRARKIDKQSLAAGNKTSKRLNQPHLLITIFTAIAIAILFFVTRSIVNKRKNIQIQFSF
jgi:hypothetical protein